MYFNSSPVVSTEDGNFYIFDDDNLIRSYVITMYSESVVRMSIAICRAILDRYLLRNTILSYVILCFTVPYRTVPYCTTTLQIIQYNKVHYCTAPQFRFRHHCARASKIVTIKAIKRSSQSDYAYYSNILLHFYRISSVTILLT